MRTMPCNIPIRFWGRTLSQGKRKEMEGPQTSRRGRDRQRFVLRKKRAYSLQSNARVRPGEAEGLVARAMILSKLLLDQLDQSVAAKALRSGADPALDEPVRIHQS